MVKKTKTMTVKVFVPPAKKYPKDQLKRGMKEEAEHTPDKKLQKVIAKVHIAKKKNAYPKKK